MPSENAWKVAWVTGASSGIGRELALQLARDGVRVAASARSEERLAELSALHSNIRAYPLDVTSAEQTAAVLRQIFEDMGEIDLAILNAGVWLPMSSGHFSAATVVTSFNVNYLGMANALEHLLPRMCERRGGHVALVSSVAGFRGLPRSAAYGPTKAAIINLAECLRHDLPRHGIDVSVINPGFVRTPLTRINKFPMPFLIEADDAAARIIQGLKRRKYDISFPWPMVKAMRVARAMPNGLFFWLTHVFTGAPRRTRV